MIRFELWNFENHWSALPVCGDHSYMRAGEEEDGQLAILIQDQRHLIGQQNRLVRSAMH